MKDDPARVFWLQRCLIETAEGWVVTPAKFLAKVPRALSTVRTDSTGPYCANGW